MKIYELRVEVVGQGVWRRLEVPARMTLAGLHLTLQRVMGWTNAGLYAFETDRARYGVLNHEDSWMRDPRDTDVRLRQIGELAARTRHIDYVYEGARRWRHAIVIEGETESLHGERYPRVVGGEGPTVLEAIEPGSWRDAAPVALPAYDEIALQASADAGFDAIARLLAPLGTTPLMPEHAPAPAPSPPPPRPLSSPPHVIRPAELMNACSARLHGEHPEQGLEAFVEEVAEHDLVGVHDMFTRKVVVDMLRRELGPEPALEAEEDLDAALDEPDEVTEAADGTETEAYSELPAPAVHDSEEAPPSDVGEEATDEHAPVTPMALPELESTAPTGAPEVAQLELGAIERLGEGAGLELEAMEALGQGARVPDGETLSAWEEESWNMDEVEVDASLGAVGELARGSAALGELPSWGGGPTDIGVPATPLWDASLDELGAMSAAGFEAVDAMNMDARVVADAVAREPFEAVDAREREAFVAARGEDESPEFEVEAGLKVLPRGHALRECLARVPARWLDVIAQKVEVDEPRRAERARRIAEELARVEVLSELVESELGGEARALAQALSAQASPRGVGWFVEGQLASPDDEAYFTFEHGGPLGELRRCGLVFVGVSGARAELEAVVPVGVRRALQLVLM